MLRYQLKGLLLPVIALFLLGYFGLHAVSRDRGFLAIEGLDHRIVEAELELSLLKRQRIWLEDRIALLREDGPIDADLLAEKARRELGLYHADDWVILLPRQIN